MTRPNYSDLLVVNREQSAYKVPYGEAFPLIPDLPDIPGPPVVALNGQPQTRPAKVGEPIVIVREGAGEGSHTNQWQRGTKGTFVEDIEGATGEKHTVTKADLGFSIRLVQTFSDGNKMYSNLIGVDIPPPPPWTNYEIAYDVTRTSVGNNAWSVGGFTKAYSEDGAELAPGHVPLEGERVIYAGNSSSIIFQNLDSNFEFGNHTDTSREKSMARLFKKSRGFTGEGLEYFDISNVRDMSSMFDNCSNFNRDLGFWDFSKVTNISSMFKNCIVFNQDVSSWDVSNVTNLNGMFDNCSNFDRDLSSWVVSNVKNVGSMFRNCVVFNQDVSSWDVSKVTVMTSTFQDCVVFNQSLNSWDVSNVTSMSSTFDGCSNFDQDLSSWDVSNVRNIDSMFRNCVVFNQDLSSWDVSKVSVMNSAFRDCSNFNGNIESWKVGSSINTGYMFANCTSFRRDLGWWSVSGVTVMDYMFNNASIFNADLSYWCVSYFKTGWNKPGIPTAFSTGASFPLPHWGTCPMPKPGSPA